MLIRLDYDNDIGAEDTVDYLHPYEDLGDPPPGYYWVVNLEDNPRKYNYVKLQPIFEQVGVADHMRAVLRREAFLEACARAGRK